MTTLVKQLGGIPLSKSIENAGYDISASESYVIPAHSRKVIHTGIQLAIPQNMYGQLHSRSGLASKGVDTCGGVIDSGYRGQIKVILHNSTSSPFEVKIGDRISQIVFHAIYHPNIQLVNELDITERGNRGFGSSGV